MTAIAIAPGATVAAEVLAAVRATVATQGTLGDVLAWARAQLPPRAVDEIVTQDEYTHDVVVRWDESTWLVYDAT